MSRGGRSTIDNKGVIGVLTLKQWRELTPAAIAAMGLPTLHDMKVRRTSALRTPSMGVRGTRRSAAAIVPYRHTLNLILREVGPSLSAPASSPATEKGGGRGFPEGVGYGG